MVRSWTETGMLLLIPEMANRRKIFGADSSWMTPYAEIVVGKSLARCSFHNRASFPAVRLKEKTSTIGLSVEDPLREKGRSVTVRPEYSGNTAPTRSGAVTDWAKLTGTADARSPIASATEMEN